MSNFFSQKYKKQDAYSSAKEIVTELKIPKNWTGAELPARNAGCWDWTGGEQGSCCVDKFNQILTLTANTIPASNPPAMVIMSRNIPIDAALEYFLP